MGQFFRKSRSIAVLADLQHGQESFLGYIRSESVSHPRSRAQFQTKKRLSKWASFSGKVAQSLSSPTFSTARKASWGISDLKASVTPDQGPSSRLKNAYPNGPVFPEKSLNRCPRRPSARPGKLPGVYRRDRSASFVFCLPSVSRAASVYAKYRRRSTWRSHSCEWRRQFRGR